MAVVTINGEYGSGAIEIGAMVAQLLEANYVDRLILVEAAKRIGATVETLAEREQHHRTFGERLSRILQNLLERSAVAGLGGEFSPVVMDTILSHPYEEASTRPASSAQEMDDDKFVKVTTEVIRDVAREGNVVIVGRASNVILKDVPGIFHAGITTPHEKRVSVIAHRENIADAATAEGMAREGERARMELYRKVFKAFKVSPEDPSLYHILINMEKLDFATASSIIVHGARCFEDMEDGGS
ncbi:MAG: cytidylate kinase-like family protein [Chloroflexi bacterium]|nr:cytidylate kinase-like family protein [Chloroflexota bacterium]